MYHNYLLNETFLGNFINERLFQYLWYFKDDVLSGREMLNIQCFLGKLRSELAYGQNPDIRIITAIYYYRLVIIDTFQH